MPREKARRYCRRCLRWLPEYQDPRNGRRCMACLPLFCGPAYARGADKSPSDIEERIATLRQRFLARQPLFPVRRPGTGDGRDVLRDNRE